MAGRAKATTGRTEWLAKYGLSDRQRMFVLNHLADPNGAKAATDAGYKNGKEMASRQLTKVNVKAAIEEGRSQIETAASMKAEKVMAMWATLAQADATELTQNFKAPCRYCNGRDHEHQWTPPRVRTAVRKSAMVAAG